MVPDGVCAAIHVSNVGVTTATRTSLTDDDTDTSTVASIHHVLELLTVTVLGRELVGHRLVVCPPLVAANALLRRVHYNHS